MLSDSLVDVKQVPGSILRSDLMLDAISQRHLEPEDPIFALQFECNVMHDLSVVILGLLFLSPQLRL